jgi:hypothetical protein
MGMLRLFSSCGADPLPLFQESSRSKLKLPNPDPNNFSLEKVVAIGRFVIVQIYYPDCTNYEGRKILVYENVSVDEITNLNQIDPHFCENDHISPIARFLPTNKGWKYAKAFCMAAKATRRKP